jgi:transposase
VIPERRDQTARRAHRPARKPLFDRAAYRRRHVTENCVGRLKEARGGATRFEKPAIHYLCLLKPGMSRSSRSRSTRTGSRSCAPDGAAGRVRLGGQRTRFR